MRCSGIGKLTAALILATVAVVSGVAYHYLAGAPLGQQAPKIELRLSNVDPPDPEPPCVIYRDIVDLPDPTWLGLTVRIFNDDTVTLYFTITGEGAGYSFNTVQYGSLSGGTNAYVNLDNFASRPRPAPEELTDGELVESVNLILKGYTDSGYSNLKWTFTKTLYVHWINSEDPAWTVDVLNNFDDGTVQGWAVVNEGTYQDSGFPQIAVASDSILSSPYSCKMIQRYSFDGYDSNRGPVRSRLYKSFTTPNKTKVFAIFNVRVSGTYSSYIWVYHKNLIFKKNTEVLAYLGKPFNTVRAHDIPKDKWIRVVVPLPANTTLELGISHEYLCSNLSSGYLNYCGYLWLDDFKIISK